MTTENSFPKGLTISNISAMSREETLILTFLLRYTDKTQELYALRLRLFYQWCQQYGLNILEVTRTHVELYCKYLKEERKNSKSCINSTLSTLRSFYDLLESDEVVYRNPVRHVKNSKVYDTEIKRTYLNRTEFCDFLETAKKLSNPKYAALTVLLGIMGLRASEAASLRIEDINTSSDGYNLLNFVGKGGKPAQIPMPIMVYREIINLIGDRTSGYVFTDKNGNCIHRHTVYHMVKTILRHTNIKKDITPHSLRRSMVTNSLNAGADIREVSKAARHADIRVTSRVYDQGNNTFDSNSFNVLSGYISGAL